MSRTNLENDIDIDAFIRSGLLHANQPADEGVADYDYSPRYLSWERSFLANPFKFAKKKGRSAFRRTLDIAAAVFLAILILYGTLIAASPSVRAAFVRWFRTLFPTHDAYEFTNTPDAQGLGKWRPTYLPDGYAEAFDIDFVGQIIVDFENEAGERITLEYMFANDGGSVHVDNEGVHVFETIVGDAAAYVYQALDGTKKNAVVWLDEDNGIAFRLESFEPYKVLVSIAESMELQK